MKSIVSFFFLLVLLVACTTSALAVPPIVENGSATTGIGYATLSGNLVSTGGAPTGVYVYWGGADGDTNISMWAHTNMVGELSEGVFSTNTTSNLLYGVTYYYRCYATNSNGVAWAESTTNFLTLPPLSYGAYRAGLLSGTVSANINTTTPNPNNGDGNAVTNMGPWRATQNGNWGGNTTYIYTGEMYFDGTGYFFVESIDDKIRLQIDGTVHIDNSSWDDVSNSGLITKPAGWYPFELRMSNGGGGSGYINRNPGFQYHNGGGTSDAEGDNWYPEDSGKMDLFRTYDSSIPVMGISIANAVPTESHPEYTMNGTLNGTQAVFDVYVYWGTNDGESVTADWGATNYIGSYTNAASTNLTFTINGLAAGTEYHYSFLAQNSATNMRAQPSEQLYTDGRPFVATRGPLLKLPTAALLGELLSDGGETTTVYTCWGTSDGGTDRPAWKHCVTNGVIGEGAFESNVNVLAGEEYFYRCYATNSLGEGWAESSMIFTTALATVSIGGDVVVTEGSEGTVDAVFTVTLDVPSSSNVWINYTTTDGTATGGVDFVSTTGTLVFASGETSKQIVVPVKGDMDHEMPDEVFYMDLSNPVNCTLPEPRAKCTIIDDDLVAIGLNFVDGANPSWYSQAIAANERVGVAVQGNWNNTDVMQNGIGDTTYIASPVADKLVDSTGGDSGVTVSWTGGWSWSATAEGSPTPNDVMMTGFLFTETDFPTESIDATVTFSGLSYLEYDVYVYFGAQFGVDANRPGEVTLNGTNTVSVKSLAFSNEPFNEAEGGDDTGHYIRFAGLTGSDVTVSLDVVGSGYHMGIYGVQIVRTHDETVEPGSLLIVR